VRPWLEVCRDAVGDIKAVLAELPTRVEREPVLQLGEGGDDTTAIDAAAETAVVHRLEQLDEHFTLVSEELGERVFGSGGPWRVVCDPIDGSLNAKRDIPFFSLSLAVAEGATMGDVVFGYVYDFGAGEEFAARRGEGATLDGRPTAARESPKGLEVIGIEAAKPEWAVPVLEALAPDVYRFRGIGSLAINLAYVAAGRLDGMVSLRDTRSVDIAAGQLILREAGGVVRFGDLESERAGLGLEERYPVVAAASPGGLEKLEAARLAGGRR
jgi:myo-inositol-1(or 4)-monophosphatase